MGPKVANIYKEMYAKGQGGNSKGEHVSMGPFCTVPQKTISQFLNAGLQK